jgi:hypothetical protein
MSGPHPSDLEIAKLLDGKTAPTKREHILNHIDSCDECFEVYSSVLKFMDDDAKRRQRVILPMAAVVLLFVISLPFLIQKIYKTPERPVFWTQAPNEQVVNYITEKNPDITIPSSFRISAEAIEIICIRLGFYVEDLERLAGSSEEHLKKKALQRLIRESKNVIKGGLPISIPDGKTIDMTIIEELENHITKNLKEWSLKDLFQFGQYIERSIFLCMEDRPPDKKPIAKFIDLSREKGFADKVPELLAKNKIETNLEVILKNLKTIREIFQ